MEHHADSLLLLNGHVVCMDEAGTQHRRGFVGIDGGRIAAVGDMSALGSFKLRDEATVIDCDGCIVMPGLINCHTHLPMVYFRGLADDLELMEWLTKHIFPAEETHLSPEFVYNATLLAAAECIKGGITCVNDMYLFAADVARALTVAGLRGLVGEGVINFPTPSAATPERGMELTRELFHRYGGDDLITPTVCAHAPYTCSPELLQGLHAVAEEHDAPFHIHLHETKAEPGNIGWLQDGESPTAALKRIGVLDPRTIGAHCVWLSADDIALAADAGASVAHCPGSNLKLASGVMPLAAMLEARVDVGLGTDGAASNNNLSLWEELHMAALLAKGVEDQDRGLRLNPEAVPARTAVELATRRAAGALKRDDIGRLAGGLRADVITVGRQSLHMAPHYGGDDAVYSQLAYCVQASDVRDVIVEGRILMRGRRLTTLNEAELIATAQQWLNENYSSADTQQ
jgi:5-methylthioadenosine/S-adenosylhomocysteine deaminase